jgi:hypothetical protein
MINIINFFLKLNLLNLYKIFFLIAIKIKINLKFLQDKCFMAISKKTVNYF